MPLTKQGKSPLKQFPLLLIYDLLIFTRLVPAILYQVTVFLYIVGRNGQYPQVGSICNCCCNKSMRRQVLFGSLQIQVILPFKGKFNSFLRKYCIDQVLLCQRCEYAAIRPVPDLLNQSQRCWVYACIRTGKRLCFD